MSQKLEVAVIGGGIGGLAAANALVANGIDVRVYEQAPALGEVGAGVFLTPNGVRQMERMGLGDQVRKWGSLVGSKSRYYRHDGTEIAPVQVTDSAGWNATFGMHRADLVMMLAENLPDGAVKTGYKATGFDQDESKARVSFANGETIEADLVIGADGIHSVLQTYVVAPKTPVYSGSIAYRGTIPLSAQPDWPMDKWMMWLGERKHFLVFPLRHGTIINFVGFVPADEAMKESWSAPGDPDQLRAEFAGWDPMLTTMLSKIEKTFRWGLYDRDPLSHWINGRLALLGDAAHAMLPHLGQGANQSIEDAMALATLLKNAGPGDLATALARYQELRLPRVADVQTNARKNGLRYDSICADLAQRDAEIVAHAGFRRSIYDYDVLTRLSA
jgi:2-polyprenyl-6-methoxyphenol hydroxylase and related FAD-dependent oxidoreductases